MTFFSFEKTSQKVMITFACLVLLTTIYGFAKVYRTRRGLQQALREATARNTRRWTTNSRTLVNSMSRDEKSLFGIRALEAGYNGGIVQARQIPRQSSMMRNQRLSQKRLSRSSGLQSRLRVLSPTTGIQLHRSSAASMDLGELHNLQAVNASEAQEESFMPPDRRQSVYGSSEDRESLLAAFAQQLNQPSTSRTSPTNFDKPLPRQPGFLSRSQATKHLSVPRLSSLKFEHKRRRLSLPLSLSSPSRASRQSWQPIPDRPHDLDGAVEYGNRYSGIDHISATTPPPRPHQRMSSAPMSMHNSSRTSATSNAFSTQFSDGILSFYGYSTPDQTTWDGMSFGHIESPMKIVSPPSSRLPLGYSARGPPVSPTPYISRPRKKLFSPV